MRTYYEKVLNGMQRPILLVAVAIVALLSASGIAMGVTSTEGTNEGHAVKSAASDRLTASAAIPTSTAFKTVTLTIPQGSGTKNIPGSVRFDSPVKSAAVVLNGFKLDYLSSDQHTDVIEVDVDRVGRTPPPPAGTVLFVAHTTHADQNSDNSYRGYVTVTVIANVQ